MAKEDFAAGFLQGLYNAGVGNPDVMRQKQAQNQETDFRQAQLDASMAEQGMTRQQDPIHSSIGDFVKTVFGVNQPRTLQTAYQPRTDQTQFGLDTQGKAKTFAPGESMGSEFTRLPPQEGQKAIMNQREFDLRMEEAKARREDSRLLREMALGKQTTDKDETLTRTIRKDIISSEPYKNWINVKNASDNLANAAANPSRKRSLSAVYSFVKALDPNSVVREGEIKLTGEARSVADRLEGFFLRMSKGMVLTPGEINELNEWAKEKESLARDTAIQANKPSYSQAKRKGLNLDEINVDLFGANNEPEKKQIPKAQFRWNPSTGNLDPL